MKNLIRKALPLFISLAIAPLAHADLIKEHAGAWLGDMKIPNGPTLKLGVELFTRADGNSWASIALPSQNNFNIPVSSVVEKDGRLHLVFSGKVHMKLKWANDHFDAEFQEQGGPALTFAMNQVAKLPMPQRPQTPQAPFPYTNEEIAIPSTEGVVLSATLSTPKNKSKPNAVILVHGAGPNDRNETGDGHQPFWVLADHLARQGIAVIRYDKRGIAKSSGDYEQHTGQLLSDDLYAVVNAAKARHQFNKIGVIGHSEGPGIAASMFAQHPKAVDFMVSMGGIGLPGLQMMLLQDNATAKANGATPNEVQTIVGYAKKFYTIMLAEDDLEKRMKLLNEHHAQSTEAVALIKKYKMNSEGGSLSLLEAAKPAMRAILSADTTTDWRKVSVPVLALNGTLDQQVPIDSLHGLAAALKAGGNRRARVIALPKLNHMFQTASTGAEDEYATIEESFAPIALQKIAEFVAKQK